MPLAWFPLRELGLLVLHTPALLLPLAALLAIGLAWCCQLPRLVWPAVALLTPVVLSVLYTPLGHGPAQRLVDGPAAGSRSRPQHSAGGRAGGPRS